MNTKLLALASALTASMALASVAEAGGGIRLGFGGPLGTFVATPTHGGGGGEGYQNKATAKKRIPVQQAARAEKPAPRVAKADTSKTIAAKADSKTESVAEETPRVTGSSALIQGSVPAETDNATQEPVSDVKAEAPSTSNTVTAAADAPQDTSGTCKKFIPAIGTTVSVGCND
jgi:hypothetical protein